MTHTLPPMYAMNDIRPGVAYRTTKIIPKPYGFIVHRMTNYISLQSVKLVYNDKGFIKATVKVNTNYQVPYQYTLYFDNKGTPVNGNNTHHERKLWLELQK